ncbi:MAG TPA: flagellar basal body rod protein FlgB [Rhizomicrobium sp.]|jgi:flagellar basal-body rod protein FlgB|nr:flagellar basal body rod protein FlgB [Rhizomicrobium sp.]
MNLMDIPLFGVLRERMAWLNARQAVLAQNVANADVPSYQAHDLKPLDFESVLKNTQSPQQFPGLTTDQPNQIAIKPPAPFEEYSAADASAQGGNGVGTEEEMMKVADTQAQYQAALNLYGKAMGLMRTAIGSPSGS